MVPLVTVTFTSIFPALALTGTYAAEGTRTQGLMLVVKGLRVLTRVPAVGEMGDKEYERNKDRKGTVGVNSACLILLLFGP